MVLGKQFAASIFWCKGFQSLRSVEPKPWVINCLSTSWEREKRRAYQQRVCEVERGSFTPLVFSTAGGMGRAASVFYKRLAGKIAEKRSEPYGNVMGWIRAVINFSLLRSSVLCLRGSRSKHQQVSFEPSKLVISEMRWDCGMKTSPKLNYCTNIVLWFVSNTDFYLLFCVH